MSRTSVTCSGRLISYSEGWVLPALPLCRQAIGGVSEYSVASAEARCPKPVGLIWTLTLYQMTCPGAENAVNFADMKFPIAYLGGGVIVAVMFLAVFVGGANMETALEASQLKRPLQGPPLSLILPRV